MLTIEVRVNDHLIGAAWIRNVSELADISNYEFTAISKPSTVTGAPAWETQGAVKRHNRIQSAWALVAKVAAKAAESEEPLAHLTPKKETAHD
jgi:hypothetical protein